MILVLLLLINFAVYDSESSFVLDIAASGNYSCKDLLKWSRIEKHYSNNKKESLFSLLNDESRCNSNPVIEASNVKYQFLKDKYFTKYNREKCDVHDKIAVIFLSNFSINNNFSHFLHSLLRLFCALIDSRLLEWNVKSNKYTMELSFVVWLDENLKLDKTKLTWLSPLVNISRQLKSSGKCISAERLVYGSGCVKLLPPEKWFGYPDCRASEVLPAFATYYRTHFHAGSQLPLVQYVDSIEKTRHKASHVQSLNHVDNNQIIVTEKVRSDSKVDVVNSLFVVFAVRKETTTVITGQRGITNIYQLQLEMYKVFQNHIIIRNISFEDLSVQETVQLMANTHVFISVHGAGMTNTFFLHPNAAIIEIIPYPLCHCKSPDYFYGIAGYYHGSALANKVKYYHYCVLPYNTKFTEKPRELTQQYHNQNHHNKSYSSVSTSNSNSANGKSIKCNWRHLHAVASVYIEESHFISLLRQAEREMIASKVIILSSSVIVMNPHANG